MSRLGWRLLFLAAFLLVGTPTVLAAGAVLCAAAVAWLAAGSGKRGGVTRLERWTQAGPVDWGYRLLSYLGRKAGVDL